MMEFTRDDAVAAAEQFLSGLARFTEAYFKDGAARSLLGIPDEDFEAVSLSELEGKYEDPVDLSDFDFPQRIGELYDFVTFGTAPSSAHMEELTSDCMQFDCIFEYTGAYLSDKMGQDVMEVQINGRGIIDILKDVQHAALARAYIAGGFGPGGNPIELSWLAALAGVNTKTIRNAATNPGPNQLKTTKYNGRLVVWPEDALAWLRTRPNFRETQFGTITPQQVESYEDIRQLALHIAALQKAKRLDIAAMTNERGWDPKTSAALESLITYAIDPSSEVRIVQNSLSPTALREFASLMGLPDPVHFAIEASRTLGAHLAAVNAKNELS